MTSSPSLPAPHPDELQRSQLLHQQLLSALQSKPSQTLGFDEFMQLTLFHPELGYYSKPHSPIGEQGDFITAPEISPYFAYTLAQDMARVMQATGLYHVLEFGAGNGSLAAGLLDSFQQQGLPPVRYSIVEISSSLRQHQQQRLQPWQAQVTWWQQLPEQFSALVVANELLDAMPVKLVRKQQQHWHELEVCLDQEGQWALSLNPANHASLELEDASPTLADGYQTETHEQAHAWLSTLAATLQQGAIWLIDYGYSASEYFAPQRANGTLACHYRHHMHTDPLWLPGLSDITAHVNFTALALTAEAAGLDVLGYTSQAAYLLNAGLPGLLPAELTLQDKAGLALLLNESAMGERFKVMLLGKGLALQGGELAAVRGFDRGDRTASL